MTSRAWSVLALPVAVVVLVLVTFALVNEPFRQGETIAAADLLHLFGVPSAAVQVRPNSSLVVLPSGGEAFLAVVTPSCSALSSLLAITFLSLFVPRRFRRRQPVALACALLMVAAGNVLRVAGSIAIGLVSGTGSLVLFHDWVGSLFAFAYTLGGYVLMLAILLPAGRPDTVTEESRDREIMSVDWTWVVGRAALLAGALMVAAAAGWRHAHRRGVRRRIARKLQDRDPRRRQAALRVATEQGLRTYAALLLARTAVETDPGVRATMVDAVLRTAWEPADRRAILDLRLWAHEERARSQCDPADRTMPIPVVVIPRARTAPAHAARPPAVPAQRTARHRATAPRTRVPILVGGRR